jgi:DNA-3-methyladenine glycosylase
VPPAGVGSPGGIGNLRRALRDAERAARALLGCTLVRHGAEGMRAGVIVETEAYLPDDPASHSFGGPTRRNASMFGPPGRAYVYRIHRSYCLNVVTGPEGRGEAVLIRAVEPSRGIELMMEARRRATVGRRQPGAAALTNGPGKLCQALGVDLELDGIDLLSGDLAAGSLRLLPRRRAPRIERSARIGISEATDALLRFYVTGSAYVSR